MYRPMTLFSYWLDSRIFTGFAGDGENGLYSPGFRLVNLLLHIAVSLMVFKLALGLRFGRATAFVAALVYAVHPIHVEAVSPAFGRGELLCAFFLLAALLMHLRAENSLVRRAGAALFFMLSFMSKENGIVFLPMIVLMDIYLFPGKSFGGESEASNESQSKLPSDNTFFRYVSRKFGFVASRFRMSDFLFRIFARYLPYLAVLAIVFCMRRYFLGSWLPAQQFFDMSIDNVIALSPACIRIATAVRLQGMALFQFAWPAMLSHDYSYAQIIPVKSVADIGAWSAAAVFAAVPAIFAAFSPSDRRKTALIVALYIISIVPAGNFIVPAGTIYAERLQYLPSIWLAIFAAMVFSRISRCLEFRLSAA
ncbi:MAG: glycosyltransferase family 39 protein, partial [Victivallales bacterium]|nr:glycosyltransferase family 39 protein [Victivallales bacterium]